MCIYVYCNCKHRNWILQVLFRNVCHDICIFSKIGMSPFSNYIFHRHCISCAIFSHDVNWLINKEPLGPFACLRNSSRINTSINKSWWPYLYPRMLCGDFEIVLVLYLNKLESFLLILVRIGLVSIENKTHCEKSAPMTLTTPIDMDKAHSIIYLSRGKMAIKKI